VLALVVIGLVAAGCGDDEVTRMLRTSRPRWQYRGESRRSRADVGDLADEKQVAAVGEAWAELFGAEDEAMCAYLHPDLGGPSSCTQYVQGALTGSSKLQASFGGATVDTVSVDGDTATAEFSNGEQVTFARDPDGAWKISETPRAS
jgi:hypothetical protein